MRPTTDHATHFTKPERRARTRRDRGPVPSRSPHGRRHRSTCTSANAPAGRSSSTPTAPDASTATQPQASCVGWPRPPGSTSASVRTRSDTASSPPPSTPASHSATSKKPRRTPTPGPRCATTEGEDHSTDTPPTSSPPSSPAPADDHHRRRSPASTHVTIQLPDPGRCGGLVRPSEYACLSAVAAVRALAVTGDAAPRFTRPSRDCPARST